MIHEYLQTYILGKKQIYKNVIYPEIENHDDDKYIITTYGDRLDRLSDEFYQTTDYWWIISIANNLPKDSLYTPVGKQLRIPANIEAITADFQRLNNS